MSELLADFAANEIGWTQVLVALEKARSVLGLKTKFAGLRYEQFLK